MASQLDRKSLKLFFSALAVLAAMVLFGFRGSLDSKFFYQGDDAGVMLGLLSDSERATYLRTEILDFLFITFYSMLSFHQFSRLLGNSKLRFVALVPGAFDVVETASISLILILGAPANLDWLGYVTVAKWSAAGLVFLLWLLLLIRGR